MIPRDRQDSDELRFEWYGDVPSTEWVREIANGLVDGEKRTVRKDGVRAVFSRRGRLVVTHITKEEA